MPAPDYTEMFNTQLSPAQERLFLDWVNRTGLQKDLADYDMRGAWLASPMRAAGGGADLPDKFKKPNHPTFSDESIYHEPAMAGGMWDKVGDNWVFRASPWNVRMHGGPALEQYFQQIEPGNQLILPSPEPYVSPPMGIVRG